MKSLALAFALAGAALLAEKAQAAPPVAGYARWFDASTLGLANDAGVTNWPDGSTNAADGSVPSGNAIPVYVANAGTETGLGAIYFAGNSNAGNSGALKFNVHAGIRTIFSVFKGNSFLLTDTSQYHFHRASDNNPADPIFNGYASANVRGGSTYVNGTLVTGTSFAMPTNLHNGFNLVEVLTTGNVQADSFNKDRSSHSGNQYQAEVIMYDRVLTEEERVSVEQYLMHKWFNVYYNLGVSLDSPTNNQEYDAGSSVTASATLYNGTAPFTVKFFAKKDAEGSFTQRGSDVTSAPYTANLGALSPGTYQIYATVTDSAGTPETANSDTSTFNVVVVTDNKGSGGAITFTDSSGLNPRSSPPHIPGYVVHAFTGSGTLAVPAGVTADVLTVGGGGGGGTVIGGGGGAGGLDYSTNVEISSGSTAVVVGLGGAGATSAGGWLQGSNGSNSSFSAISAVGGGGGGGWNNTSGRAGGSGGGPCRNSSVGLGTSGQGNAGGNGAGESPGGGGGAGAPGSNGVSSGAAGAGGDGLAYEISGVATWYAGGGGGGGGNSCNARGLGGNGGGGAGAPPNSNVGGTKGVAGTGGGGGGGSWSGGTAGGAGGSGIVVVRYPYATLGLAVAVSSPSANQVFPNGSSISATAAVLSGTGPYTVTFYQKTGSGAFTQVGSPQTGVGPAFIQALGTLANESYEVYATVTDSISATASSEGNPTPFTVVAPVTTTTTLASSANSSTYPQSVTYTATVAPTPTGGTVQFYSGGNPLGSPVAVNTGNGTAQYNPGLLSASTYAITAHFSGYSQYIASDASVLSQTVNKVMLTVTADNKVRSPGTANPAFTYVITGFVNSENAASAGVTGAPILATTASMSSPVGPYAITNDVSPLAAANYSFAGVTGTLTVAEGAPPTVTANMMCWFDASVAQTNGSGVVTSWPDQSGYGRNATQGGGTVTLATGEVNSRPAVRLRSGGFMNCTTAPFTSIVKEQYVIVRSPNVNWSGGGSFFGRKSNDFLTVRGSSYNMSSGTTGFWQDHFPTAVSKNGKPVSRDVPYGNGPGFRLYDIQNYMLLKITVDNDGAGNIGAYPYYQIGKNETTGTMDFDVAEIIGFDTALNDTDQNKVNTYLANKYGLTVMPVLDVTAQGVGAEILNTGTLVEANHFGGSGVAPITLDNGLTFGASTAALIGIWGGQNTDSDAQNLVPNVNGNTPFGNLMRHYRWNSAQTANAAIPGLTIGHIYRLQWITASPRGGNISVEDSPSLSLTGSSDHPTVLSFTWTATDDTANILVTRQNSPHYGGSYDSEMLWNGYALHDMSVTAGYAAWAAAQVPPLLGGPGAVGNDGLANLLVYAIKDLKTDGTNSAAGTLAGRVLSFTKRADAVANGDVTYEIETSPDLNDPWTTVTTDSGDGTTINYTLPENAGEIYGRLKVTIP